MFKIQLHDFAYTARRTRWGSKQLQFTLTWSFTTETTQDGISMPGCLAWINKKGELMWAPPMTVFGNGSTRKHLFTETPDTYHRVRLKLENSEFSKAMRDGMMEILKEVDPYEENPGLPKVLEDTV